MGAQEPKAGSADVPSARMKIHHGGTESAEKDSIQVARVSRPVRSGGTDSQSVREQDSTLSCGQCGFYALCANSVVKPLSYTPSPMRRTLRRAFLLVAALIGCALGVGMFTFHYGEGWSYFSTDPRSCVNCHIMQPQYDSWLKSSHHAVAGCVDCHLPHSLVPKLIAKADNGFRHSWAFTFQDFHEPIQIIDRNKRILESNCRECHAGMVEQMLAFHTPEEGEKAISCVHCHSAVGHGPVR